MTRTIETRVEELFGWLSSALAFAFTILIFLSAAVLVLDDAVQRIGAIAISLAIVILKPSGKADSGRAFHSLAVAVKIGLMTLLLFEIIELLRIYESFWDGLFTLSDMEIAIGYGGVLLVIEVTRRAFGLPLAIVAGVALAYAITGNDWPSFLRHAGVASEDIVRTAWFSFDGVFGRPASVVSSLVLIFLVFGGLLQGTGTDKVLLKFSTAVTGGIRGGPAHAAIVASSLFGTISGSVVANVVGTGVFTIPMIKRQGFKPSFAGGVEAAASSGGQFMPPIMAAAAFVMAELTGTSYLLICLVALLPALFFYLGLFTQVYCESVRLGIKVVPVEDRERLDRADYLRLWKFLLPMIGIIATMIFGRSPAMAGVFGIIILTGLFALETVIEYVLDRDRSQLALKWRGFFAGFVNGGKSAATIMVAVAAIGIVLGVVNETSLGFRFASGISSMVEGSIFLGLLTAMAASLLLGMGLPTLPAYLLVALLIGPGIVKLGPDWVLVHLFVLYYAVLSAITPPVAIAAFGAGTIAGANPMITAIQAVRLSLVGFIIPFVFVYYPEISLHIGFDAGSLTSWTALASILFRLTFTIWMLSTAISGAGLRDLFSWPQRLARAVIGIGALLIWPEVHWGSVACGLVLLTLPVLMRRREIDNRSGT